MHQGARLHKGLAGLAITAAFVSLAFAALAQTTWRGVGPKPIANAQANFDGVLVGPTFNSAGRVTAIAADPTQAGRIFVGTANGGLWMITTVKSSPVYSRISDTFPNPTQAIGAIALDSSTNPATLYVGTGEGNYAVDTYYGRGLFYSTDLGSTWTELGHNDFPYLAFTSLTFASISGTNYLFAGLATGVSTDRSASSVAQRGSAPLAGLWSVTLASPPFPTHLSVTATGLGPCFQNVAQDPCPADDVVALPNGTGGVNLFAALDGLATVVGSVPGVYLSTDTGNTWTPVLTAGACAGLTACPTNIGRIKLAGSMTTLYAMIGGDSPSNPFSGFFASTNAGTGMTWNAESVPCFAYGTTVIDGTATGAGTSGCANAATKDSQSFYDQAMAVSPTQPLTVYFGGIGLYKSTNGGSTWSFFDPSPGNIGSYHSDQHAIVFDPFDSTSSTLYLGNDGGLFVYQGGAFSDRNSGLKSAQLYGVGIDAGSPPRLLGGLQDNGTIHYDTINLSATPTPDPSWNAVDTGDAGVVPFAPNNPNWAFHTYLSNGGIPSLAYSANGGVVSSWSWKDATSQLDAQFISNNKGDTAVLLPPIAVSTNPLTPSRILYGGHYAYAVGFGTGTPIASVQSSASLTPGCANGVNGCAIQDIAFNPSDGTKAWAISANAGNGYQVSCTKAADQDNAAWTSVSNAGLNVNSSGFPTGITISPVPSGGPYPVYVTMFAPAGSTNPINTIFETTSGCTANPTWTALVSPTYKATGEPLSVLRLMVDKQDPTGNTLIAGTDIGVYRSTDGGHTWVNSGERQVPPIPRAPVMDVEENLAGDIAIATHGSGAFLMTPTPTPTPVPTPTPTPIPTATPTPTPPTFLGNQNVESECDSSPCGITFNAPAGSQAGDLFLVALSADNATGILTPLPPGWTALQFINQGGSQIFNSYDSSFNETGWLLAYVYGSVNPDPGQYSFSAGITYPDDEVGGELLAYRGVNTSSLNFSAWGFGNYGDNQTVSVGPVPATANNELVALFLNASDDYCPVNSQTCIDDGSTVSFSPISGSPPLTPLTGMAITGGWTGFAADAWSGSGGTFGTYATTATSSTPGFNGYMYLGWLVLLPTP